MHGQVGALVGVRVGVHVAARDVLFGEVELAVRPQLVPHLRAVVRHGGDPILLLHDGVDETRRAFVAEELAHDVVGGGFLDHVLAHPQGVVDVERFLLGLLMVQEQGEAVVRLLALRAFLLPLLALRLAEGELHGLVAVRLY